MIAVLFILGLAIGSFMNVLSLRYQESANQAANWRLWFGGRSRCPSCGNTLKWYELIPLFSFFIQLGRCRHCHQKISWQYPIIEFLTAAAFLALFFKFVDSHAFVDWHRYLELAIWLAVFSVFIALALIDLRLSIIPDGANVFLAVAGLALMILHGSYAPYFLAAAVGLLFFGGVVFFTRGRGMGIGDVKLAGAIGLLLGWPQTLIAFMAAFIIGAFCGIFLIWRGKKTMKDSVPFGPFLVIGAMFGLLAF